MDFVSYLNEINKYIDEKETHHLRKEQKEKKETKEQVRQIMVRGCKDKMGSQMYLVWQGTEEM